MRLAYPGADTDLIRSTPAVQKLIPALDAAFPDHLRLGSSIRPADSYPDHRLGAAVDLMTGDRTTHEAVTSWLIDQHKDGAIRLRSLISWYRRWTPTLGWHTYQGALPHTDHIHVWLDVATATAAYPLTTRGRHRAYYGHYQGPVWSVGGARETDRPAVRQIQATLRARGYRVAIDGIYGDETTRAVRAYQTDRGLTADGLVGPLTWTELMR